MTEEIPKWFWQIIDDNKPDLKKLEAALENLEREKLEDYYGYYLKASQLICEPWQGPYINESIGCLSEDGTEDLCDWIVSQGHDYWISIDAGDEALAKAFWLHEDLRKNENKALVKWTHETTNPEYQHACDPKYLATAIYEKRFGENLYDHVEKIMMRVGG